MQSKCVFNHTNKQYTHALITGDNKARLWKVDCLGNGAERPLLKYMPAPSTMNNGYHPYKDREI